MSLALLRGSARRMAVALVVISLWSLPHVAQMDDLCPAPGAEEHDESKHVFTTATPAADQEHCAICHWVRSMNLGVGMRELTAIPVASDSRFLALVSHSLRDPGTNRIPARAPPVL